MARIFLLTGLSGAGKTTLAQNLVNSYRGSEKCVILDGDEMRNGLCDDLGFSANDRRENIRRCAEMAKLLLDQGLAVIMAVIAPYESLRQQIADIVGSENLAVIHISCPLEVCVRRDPKNNYKNALAGRIHSYTGIGDSYEIPANPDLVIRTHEMSLSAASQKLRDFVTAHLNGENPQSGRKRAPHKLAPANRGYGSSGKTVFHSYFPPQPGSHPARPPKQLIKFKTSAAMPWKDRP